jgi:uncharacterized protein YuzE
MEGDAMSYDKIDRSGWKDFFDAVSKGVEGRLVEFEFIGRDLGDQEFGGQLNLNGITYDKNDDALYVSILDGRLHFDHVVQAPKDIYVEIDDRGFSGLMVTDANGRLQFVKLREPLLLPASATGSS